MTTTAVFQAVRAANVALVSIALLTLIVWLSDIWSTLSLGRKLSMSSVRLLFVASVVGAAYAYATGAPLNPASALVTIAAVGVIVGQFLARHDPANPSHAPHKPAAPPADACDFPGCIAARIAIRQIQPDSEGRIPRAAVMAILDGVEAHEHRGTDLDAVFTTPTEDR